MATLVYDGIPYELNANAATITVIRHLILTVANGERDSLWLPGMTAEDGREFSILLTPGVGAVVLADPGFVEMDVDDAIAEILAGEGGPEGEFWSTIRATR